jgi:hypothetical protein
MSEKGRWDSIIGTNRYWPELFAVKEESWDKSTETLERSYRSQIYFMGILACDGVAYSCSIFGSQEAVREGHHD